MFPFGAHKGSRKQSFLVRLLVARSTAVVSVSLRDVTRSFFGRRVFALLLWVGLLRHSYSPPRLAKLARMGVERALARAGAIDGDVVRIGTTELTYEATL